MDPSTTPVRIWDLPTRIFHWSLATCVIGSVTSAKIGGNAMDWHFRFGYAVFALLGFRIVWGLIGAHWSRFASFAYGPGALRRYLRGTARAGEHFEAGHSPLGALSVFAMLLVLGAQVGTGLIADDEIASAGPMVRFVSGATSALATGWHKSWGQWLIITLALLHVGAIAYYTLRRGRPLVRAMFGGDKVLPGAVPASADTARTRALAAVVVAACAAVVAWLVSLGG